MLFRIAIAMAGLSILAPSAQAGSLGGEASDVVAARANARAGGPVSERDAEVLERYGCLSGSASGYCESLSHRRWREAEQPRRRIRRSYY